MLLLSKTIELATGNSFVNLKDFNTMLSYRRVYLYAFLIVWLISWLYFNTKRTRLLLEKYDKLYEETKGKTTLKMILSLVVPLVLFVILMAL